MNAIPRTAPAAEARLLPWAPELTGDAAAAVVVIGKQPWTLS